MTQSPSKPPGRKQLQKTAVAPRRRDRRDTEARLFQAATEVMSAVGYEAATTKRIAEKAGANEQLISRYFGGKAGLLVAILGHHTRTEDARERAARPRVADTLELEIAGFLAEADFAIDSEPFARLALGRAVLDASVAEAIHKLCRECWRPLLLERLRAHRERGRIDPVLDLESTADALIQLRLGLAAYGRMLFGLGHEHLAELRDTSAEIFARGLASMAPIAKSPGRKKTR